MKQRKSLFKFPFVIIRRKKYQELIDTEVKAKSLEDENEIIEQSRHNWMNIAMDLEKQISNINLKRNAKGQFERRAK